MLQMPHMIQFELCPCLYSVPGPFVNPPQEPHGDSSPCRALPQDINPQCLGSTSSLHFIHFNTIQESYTDLQPSSNEPMQVVSVWNLNGFSFLQPESFISHQRSHEEATRESLPRRQHSESLRRSSPKPLGNNATSPQPASYHKITSPPKLNPFRCIEETCKRLSFKDERTLKRHQTSKHSGVLYVCRCGYSNGRKDTYWNHLDKENCSGEGLYTCICGYSTDDLAEHRPHLKRCRRGKQGRPTKDNAG
ncbi:hypothetical protein DER46DRAFT_264167 [Fusarium sp. MPI-SDFR-AT-0072]|nr:hypothetical protein DER46DRAFT_264167 [Fusarium sp. MPI-SDFR-AT-0072]